MEKDNMQVYIDVKGMRLKLIIAEVLHEKTRDELEKRRLRNGVN